MSENIKNKPEKGTEDLEAHKKLGDGWVPDSLEDTVFVGEYKHNLDQKGRIALPVKFRQAFEKGVIVTRGLDNCLFVYSKKDWKILAKKISKLPLTKSNARAFARLMLAGAMDADLDGQGRIIVPEYLRDYAKLKKKTIIAGIYNRLEIWSNGRWSRYKKSAEENSSNIAEELGELGI